tara:strand:+ start:1351 stop:3075 length:1725 start_codon:yes stop_codon:yes gene_type:complete
MGENQILQLAENFLKTPKGKALLGESLNIEGITSRITTLAKENNIDLSSLEASSGSDLIQASSLAQNPEGQGLTKQQRRERRENKKQTAQDRIKEREAGSNVDPEEKQNKVIAEIQKLKAKLKSQTPTYQEFNITGRLFDKTTGEVLKGAKVQPGVSQIQIGEPINQTTPVDSELVSNTISISNPNDLVYTPSPELILNGPVLTDKKGNFNIKMKIPIIPSNQKVPINIALLYSKSGSIPSEASLLNGDKTVRTALPASSLTNINEAAEQSSQEFINKIDLAQSLVSTLALKPFDLVISARKLSIAKVVDTIKTKLIPLALGMLIAFGISKLTQINRKTCPTPDALNGVLKTRNRVVRQLNQIYTSILTNTALAAVFFSLSKVLRGVRLSLDALPAPQAIGIIPAKDFGGLIFAQPYSFTAKLQHVNDELEKLEEQFDGMNRSTLTSLVFLIAGTATVLLLLKGVDGLLQECAEENEENGASNLELETINNELLALSEEEAEDGNPVIGSLNGFIFSVETDNKNLVGTLKRRFAVAKNQQGVTLLKGESSFSSNNQILIDELVFYIQQNDLKAY